MSLTLLLIGSGLALAETPTLSPSLTQMFRTTLPVGERDADGSAKAVSAEVYNVRLGLTGTLDPLISTVELRFRQAPLRSFSPGNVWLQQAWMGLAPDVGDDTALQVQAGLFYKQVGLSWDGSWFGNLPYLNAHKLDPDLGIGLDIDHQLTERVTLAGTAQFFVKEDGLNGFYAPAAKLAALGADPSVGADLSVWDGYVLDPDSATTHTERLMTVVNLHPTFGREVRFTPVLTGFRNEIVAPFTDIDGNAVELRANQLIGGAGAILRTGGLQLHGETLAERFSFEDGAGRSRLYWLGGAVFTHQRDHRWLPWLRVRANVSGVSYTDEALTETFVAPAVQLGIVEHLDLTAEYVRWWMPQVQDEAFVDRVELVLTASI